MPVGNFRLEHVSRYTFEHLRRPGVFTLSWGYVTILRKYFHESRSMDVPACNQQVVAEASQRLSYTEGSLYRNFVSESVQSEVVALKDVSPTDEYAD